VQDQGFCSEHSRHTRLADDLTEPFELVGQEPVAELRVVVVRVDQRVGQVGVIQLALADRLPQPGVVRLR
jgi:hypothetical protein